MGLINLDLYFAESVNMNFSNTYICISNNNPIEIKKDLTGNYSIIGHFEIFITSDVLKPLETISIGITDLTPEQISTPINLLYAKLKEKYPNHMDC